MRINHNISALNAWRNITQVNYSLSKTLERLSSGLRINRAGDDAAGLAISEKMRGQIKGLNMAIKNAQDAISLIQTAEGALTEVHSILQRMRELAVQATSDTNTDVDRNQIQQELDQLREEIDRIARTTEFNTKKLLDGKLESFRAQADVKVVTGGNINLQAQEVSVQQITVPTAGLWTTVSLNTTLYNAGTNTIYIDTDSNSTTVYRSYNVGGYTIWVGFVSVGANNVRVVAYNNARGTNTIGHATLTGDGKVQLSNIFGTETITSLGYLSIDFDTDTSLGTVLQIDLIQSSQYRLAESYTSSTINAAYGGPTLMINTPDGGDRTVYAEMNISGVTITVGAKSVGGNSVQIFVWQGSSGAGTLGHGTLAADGNISLLDAFSGSTLLDLTTIGFTFDANKDAITDIRVHGTSYVLPSDTSDTATAIDYDTSVTLGGTATLNFTDDVYMTVSLSSVGTNSVRYVVKSYSGMTLAHGTIDKSSFSSGANGLYTVSLNDDLVVNLQFYNAVTLNSAYVYLTTSDYEADEGSYVAEVGQLSGNLTSALDYRILKASESGVTTVGVDQLRRGFHFENGLLFSWNYNEFTINDFGGSLPLNEVVDSAVARVEEKYTGNTQLVFQIGANEGHNMIAGIDDMSAGALGITSVSLDVTTQDKAERTIMVIDAAIHKVSTARASLGAIQNRLEHTIANLGVAAENLTAAESRIRDADMAKEMMTFVKQQILLQSANAMLAQANALPQNVLQLLR